MNYPNGIKNLLKLVVVLLVILFAWLYWFVTDASRKHQKQEEDIRNLSGALEEAHQENPDDVPAPDEVIEDPPDPIGPTDEQVAAAVSIWLNSNPPRDNPDPNDPDFNDLDPNDLDFNDPEIQDPDPNDPEAQDDEVQDEEIQDDEVQDEEIQDPEVDDPEIQDPEIDDPDPGLDSFDFPFNIGNRSWIVTCTDPDGDRHYTCSATELERER